MHAQRDQPVILHRLFEQRQVAVDAIEDLPGALRESGVDLRVMERLTPLHGLWETTTLHWSAIRMSNAQDWTPNPGTVPARLRP